MLPFVFLLFIGKLFIGSYIKELEVVEEEQQELEVVEELQIQYCYNCDMGI